MTLHEYLLAHGSLSVSQLRERVGAQSDAQVRQWQHGYAGRKPSFDNSVAIEKVTDGRVTVEDLHPDAPWLRVKDKTWPHPKGRPVLDFAHAEPKTEQGA